MPDLNAGIFYKNIIMDIAALRKEYMLSNLSETDVAKTPHQQFEKWWDDAVKSEIIEPNAMALSTVSADGIPSNRIVLLKGFDSNGLVFFTNYESRKGREISHNQNVSVLFFWKELERQVRINGRASKTNADQSDAYFQSRPLGSRIGAWASPQSQVITDRFVLEKNVKVMEEKFSELEVPRPEHWGGYLIAPSEIEFWQGRPSRLHDRILYTKDSSGSWKIQRLAP